ncbi:MBL fold metallo-hydrolase [Fonticella tunisiensis]|uniref:Cft2 family RNA processing exonuclease n=1 Tax=Fonticella tunisiensis TaxID=1096341 RepID=A0A4R7KB01_9CLOT|nr:MBL fold metallo-hydrolase [Fonticella tunisiensis]TDT51040.1 Cft2 family RNA processing exonuclease [Fonticella tunisiensis]
MKITFCGGAGEVGASCILLNLDGKNILLDCGVRPKGGKDSLPDLGIIQRSGGVDAIIVSHAHLDHTGALPVISREYPDARIYMTHMTKGLVRVLLYDSLKIMNRGEEEIPIYAEKHVLDMLGRAVCFSPQFTFRPFNDSDIKITFYPAGHVAGAVMAYIEGREGTVLYTGDISGTDQRTVPGASLPRLRPDVLIMESTYGDKLHSNRQVEEERLVQTVKEVISRGGRILIPAFALGRAQEVILILKKAMNKGELPSFKIYVDGMVKDINRVYRMYPNYLKNDLAKKVLRGIDIFYDDNIAPVENNEMRDEILNSKEPLCIISSSGMLTGGPSPSYAEKFAGDERNFIAITGYQDEEAPGREILEMLNDIDRERELNINGKTIPLKCGIGQYGLSAHSDKGELLGIINRTTPKRVFLVHGDREIIQSFGKWLNGEIRSSIYAPVSGESFDFSIVNPRKQLHLRDKIKPLNIEESFSEDNALKLWEYLFSLHGTLRSYSVEELMEIWGGERDYLEDEVYSFRDVLNRSKYFTTDLRRMFLYRPVDKEEIKDDDGPMEVNEMLRFVESVFPEEARLYKKGARQDEKKVLLYFSFPQAAKEKYSHLIERVEKETGWEAIVNRECNLIEAESLVKSLLPEGAVLKKFSYFRDEGYFMVEIDGEVHNFEAVRNDFKETTGLDLKLKSEKRAEENEVLNIGKFENMMEQNMAFEYIENAFKNERHRIYKKSKKVHDGIPYIELSFITPEVGEKYRKKIDALQKETGWSIVIGKNPNQNEIIKVAKEICSSIGITLIKNPSIYTSEKAVKIKVAVEVEENKRRILEDRFKEETGYEVIIV